MLILTGPTCSGKTEIAQHICRKVPYEIISVDTGCFYKDVRIGNGKFTIDKDTPYHMIDLIGLNERMTVRSFLDMAIPTSMRIRERGKLPLACGGSMLYMERLIKGLNGPSHDPCIANDIREIIKDLGPHDAHDLLFELDPAKAFMTHPNDLRRLSRALITSLGPLQDTIKGISTMGVNWKGFFIDRSDRELKARIGERTMTMLEKGWLSEVGSIIDSGYTRDFPGLEMIGVNHIIGHMNKVVSNDELFDAIVRSNMDLVRKQRKWRSRLGLTNIFLKEGDMVTSAQRIMEAAMDLYE
ncbi:MAG: tRNA (adenosine(37)-N6)-dimethylallyltransferase MiaA [Candidatus Thermoplasmatota archaeon]|nr:tRNA (adenosine(37)-N6)-dimethylallyltransferase MiaA [Candidatus Thermoplasmatota archaeon]